MGQVKIVTGVNKAIRNLLVAASVFGIAVVASQTVWAAEKLRVGINLTTIETLPIYLAADGKGAVELSWWRHIRL